MVVRCFTILSFGKETMTKYIPLRSGLKWFRLITECRQNSIHDSVWCRQHDIPVSSFYNAVTRLQKEACTIPEKAALSGRTYALDFTSHRDVTWVNIYPNPEVATTHTDVPIAASHLDTPHTIGITTGEITAKISNSASPGLLAVVFHLLKG